MDPTTNRRPPSWDWLELLADIEASHATAHIAWTLWSMADEFGEAWPRWSTIQRLTNSSKGAVDRALKTLTAADLLTSEVRVPTRLSGTAKGRPVTVRTIHAPRSHQETGDDSGGLIRRPDWSHEGTSAVSSGDLEQIRKKTITPPTEGEEFLGGMDMGKAPRIGPSRLYFEHGMTTDQEVAMAWDIWEKAVPAWLRKRYDGKAIPFAFAIGDAGKGRSQIREAFAKMDDSAPHVDRFAWGLWLVLDAAPLDNDVLVFPASRAQPNAFPLTLFTRRLPSLMWVEPGVRWPAENYEAAAHTKGVLYECHGSGIISPERIAGLIWTMRQTPYPSLQAELVDLLHRHTGEVETWDSLKAWLKERKT